MLVDSHVHLQDKKFARDLDRVVQRATLSGLEHMVVIGDRIESSRKGLALARQNPLMSAVVGVHPHHANGFTPRNLIELKAMAADPKTVGIGEIGLDYHYPQYDPIKQKEVFRTQAHLATRHNLPIVVHCRDAYEDLLELIRTDPQVPRRGIIHCFSGTCEQAHQFLDLGFHLGIGGAVTYPNGGELRETVASVGLDRLVVETDAPYLPPQSKRGRRNEPSYLKHTVKMLADLTGETFQDAARVTKANAIQLFGLPTELRPEMLYGIHRSLHICLTNRCTNQCYDCQRCSDYLVHGHLLKLDHEPEVDEVLGQIEQLSAWDEVVISGLGEPTLRWETCLKLAEALKERGARVRLNTNGLGSLINKRDITPELAGRFDVVSVHMAAHDQPTYNRVTRTSLPEEAWGAMLEFVRDCRKMVPEVILSVTALPEIDVEACRALAEDDLKVQLRLREYRPHGYPLAGCTNG